MRQYTPTFCRLQVFRGSRLCKIINRLEFTWFIAGVYLSNRRWWKFLLLGSQVPVWLEHFYKVFHKNCLRSKKHLIIANKERVIIKLWELLSSHYLHMRVMVFTHFLVLLLLGRFLCFTKTICFRGSYRRKDEGPWGRLCPRVGCGHSGRNWAHTTGK